MKVREVIAQLQTLDPDTLVLAQGTEYSMPVESVGTATVQRCDEAGTVFPNGETMEVAFLYVDYASMGFEQNPKDED